MNNFIQMFDYLSIEKINSFTICLPMIQDSKMHLYQCVTTV